MCIFPATIFRRPIVTEDAAPAPVSRRTAIKVMKVSRLHAASEPAGSQSPRKVIAISGGQLPVLKGRGRAAGLTIAPSTSL